MREFTKVSPLVWRSKKFRTLSQADKMIYIYLVTSPHSNSIGCYTIPLVYIAADLGLDDEAVRKGIERVTESLLIGFDFDEEMVLIHNFLTFNAPTNPNHAKMMQREASALPQCKLKNVFLETLNRFCEEKNWKGIESLSEAYRKPIERVSPLDQTRPDQTRLPLTPKSPKRKLPGVLPLAIGRGLVVEEFDIRQYLDEDTLATAKRNAPGWDINGYLANVYNSGIKDGSRERPDNPARAFPAWCAKYTKGKRP